MHSEQDSIHLQQDTMNLQQVTILIHVNAHDLQE